MRDVHHRRFTLARVFMLVVGASMACRSRATAAQPVAVDAQAQLRQHERQRLVRHYRAQMADA